MRSHLDIVLCDEGGWHSLIASLACWFCFPGSTLDQEDALLRCFPTATASAPRRAAGLIGLMMRRFLCIHLFEIGPICLYLEPRHLQVHGSVPLHQSHSPGIVVHVLLTELYSRSRLGPNCLCTFFLKQGAQVTPHASLWPE